MKKNRAWSELSKKQKKEAIEAYRQLLLKENNLKDAEIVKFAMGGDPECWLWVIEKMRERFPEKGKRRMA